MELIKDFIREHYPSVVYLGALVTVTHCCLSDEIVDEISGVSGRVLPGATSPA
jgi:hypothetical protein